MKRASILFLIAPFVAAGLALGSGGPGETADNVAVNAGVDTVTSGGENTDAGDVNEGETYRHTLLHANRDQSNKIALTFDDGPHPVRTAPILDILAKYGVRATFFVVGENVEAHPELLEREILAGHEIGNHTNTHPDLSKLTYRAACDEVLAAENAVFAQNEYRTRLLRPPGGAYSDAIFRLAARLDYDLILWSVDTRDWAHTTADDIVKTVSSFVSGGDVILFHDFISGEAHTAEALESIIPQLLSEGYEFVTVSELFGLG